MAFQRVIPLTVAAALFMENMDSTVIATALPSIARDLRADPVALKLAFTAYLITLAAFIPMSGWAADRFGARHVFRAAIAVFTLASIGCALAGSLETLVAARATQGLGGSMMIPVGRALLVKTVAKEELVRAMVFLTVPALAGPLVGPPLGGLVTETLGWRWIFWINVPFGLAALALATRHMPDVREEAPGRFDLKGFLLAGPGLCALIFGFTTVTGGLVARERALAIAGLGLVLLGLYIRHAWSKDARLVDLGLFGIATLRSSLLGGFGFRLGAGALAFVLPLMLQIGLGLDAFRSGLLTLAGAAGAIAMKFTAAPLLRRFGFRRILIFNALICGAFLFGYAFFAPAVPKLLIFAVLLAGGFFRSLQFTSLGALGYADVAPRDTAQASTLFGVFQQTAIASGVALAAFILDGLRHLRGETALALSDFAAVLAVMAAFTALSGFAHLRLDRNAGAAVSGNRRGETPADSQMPT